MDFQQRISDATAYRDQTKNSYEQAKNQTAVSQGDYDKSYTQAPSYASIYEKYRNEYTATDELTSMQKDWQQTKDNVDMLRTMINKLPQSIGQAYGGSALTQSQRDKARQQQLGQLSSQFTQYDASYQAKFTDYNEAVDKAFAQSLDVANKDYDSYWDKAKMKYNEWQTNITNEKQWSQMFSQSNSDLQRIQLQYDSYKFQQQLMQQQREFESWLTNFKTQQANSRTALAAQSAQSSLDLQRRQQENKQFNNNLIAQFQQNKMSWNQVESQYRQ